MVEFQEEALKSARILPSLWVTDDAVEAHQHARSRQYTFRGYGWSFCSRIVETALITLGGNIYLRI